jgi:hypothetical protein
MRWPIPRPLSQQPSRTRNPEFTPPLRGGVSAAVATPCCIALPAPLVSGYAIAVQRKRVQRGSVRSAVVQTADGSPGSLQGESDDRRADLIWAAAIFVLALFVRLLWVFSRADFSWPYSAMYEGDAPQWVLWAQKLAAGRPYEYGLPFRSPGVAHLLYWLGAGDPAVHSFAGYKVLWCVLSSLTCVVAYFAMRLMVARRIALIAAGLSVFSFGLLELSASLNNETPYGLCVFAAIWLSMVFIQRPAWWLAIILALLHGVAMLLRAEHPLVLAAMSAWILWRWWQESPAGDSSAAPIPGNLMGGLARIAVIAGGAVAVCIPWSISSARALAQYNATSPDVPQFDASPLPWTAQARGLINALPAFARDGNFRYITFLCQQQGKTQVTDSDVVEFFRTRFHYMPEPLPRWTLLSIKGPLDFALANHPQAEGGFARFPLMEQGDPNPTLHLAQPDHLYLVNHGYRRGWEYITSDWSAFGRNLLLKLRNFSDGIALGFTAANLPVSPYGIRRAIDITVPEQSGWLAWKAAILMLCVIGLGLAMARTVGGLFVILIGCKLIVTLVFYGYARQAASIYPAFALLIALPLDLCVTHLLDIRWRVPLAAKWSIVGALVGLGLLIGMREYGVQRGTSIEGPIVPAPQWQPAGFECNNTIHLKPLPTS